MSNDANETNETNETNNFAIRRFQCRHIFTDGHRCGSPCLRGQDFCYYHHETRRAQPLRNQFNPLPHDPYNDPPNQTGFFLPNPEDHSSIQHALGRIMNRLASNALDPRRASLLLYALQIASGNLKGTPKHRADDMVQEVTQDPVYGPLAPANELPNDVTTRAILEALTQDDEEEDEEEDDNDEQDIVEDYEDEVYEDTEDQEDNEIEGEDDGRGNGSLSVSASSVPTPSPTQSRKYPPKSHIERTLEKSTRGGGYPAPYSASSTT